MPVSPRTRASTPEDSSAHSNNGAVAEGGMRIPRPLGRPTKETPDWAPEFLTALTQGHSVQRAAQIANVHIQTPYDRRKRDPQFLAAWREAAEISTEHLEQEAQRRAYHGTNKPVFYKGQRCGAIRVYSDALTMFLLKARKPETYRDGQEDSGKNITLNINVVSVGETTIDPPGLTLTGQTGGVGEETHSDRISNLKNEVPSVQDDSKG